jgi:hypothetical protein
MQTQITLNLADDEFVHVKQATLQAGFRLEEYLNFVLKAILQTITRLSYRH